MSTQSAVRRPDRVVLEGILGSRAYGLGTERSDTDRLGVFVAPTREILGLRWGAPSLKFELSRSDNNTRAKGDCRTREAAGTQE